jgi:hypothetical protein
MDERQDLTAAIPLVLIRISILPLGRVPHISTGISISKTDSCNCTPVGANCKTNEAVSREKPGDSLPSLPRPPHREPFKSIAPTPIHPPLSPVIRIRGVAVDRLVCWKRQQRNPAQHRREPYSRQVSFRQQQPIVTGMLHQPTAGFTNLC